MTFNRKHKLANLKIALILSLLAHLGMLFPLAEYGHYHFARAVMPAAVSVELTGVQEPRKELRRQSEGRRQFAKSKPKVTVGKPRETSPPVGAAISAAPVMDAVEQNSQSPNVDQGAVMGQAATIEEMKDHPIQPASKSPLHVIAPPLRDIGEFTTTNREQLNYRISMMGVPIGFAELEAKNIAGELRISLKVKSTPALSAIYPVDDLIEVRHIGGNFIITKIRQQEGNFKSNRGFTIFLRDKRVFWMDLLRNRSLNETIPNEQVLDLVSAFYYLRNRPLAAGTTESLHVYDSDTYSLVPVEVLRRERVSLPAFRHADTLMVRPRLKTDGIFKHTGEVTIWLTDDEFKVPVRFETSIPLGKITAELVSADTETSEPAKNISSVQPMP